MWIVFALSAAIAASLVVTLSKLGVKDVDSSLAFAIEAVLILIVSWSVVIGQGHLPDVTRIERRVWIYLVGCGCAHLCVVIMLVSGVEIGKCISGITPDQFFARIFGYSSGSFP